MIRACVLVQSGHCPVIWTGVRLPRFILQTKGMQMYKQNGKSLSIWLTESN